MDYKKVVITPQKAKQILENGIQNRSISKCKVSKYAFDMKNGYWEEENPIGSLLIFEKGKLKDGQHRVSAVIEANKPIKFTICETQGKTFVHFDEGKSRTPANIMQLEGIETSLANRTMTSIASLLLSNGNDAKRRELTSSALKEFILNNSELLLEAHRICCSGTRNSICRVAPMFAAVFEALKADEDKNKLERFCYVVNTGFSTSEKESVAVVARNFLLDSDTKQQNRSGASRGWNEYGLLQEYIHLFCQGSTRRNRVNKPSFYYYSKNNSNDKEV